MLKMKEAWNYVIGGVAKAGAKVGLIKGDNKASANDVTSEVQDNDAIENATVTDNVADTQNDASGTAGNNDAIDSEIVSPESPTYDC